MRAFTCTFLALILCIAAPLAVAAPTPTPPSGYPADFPYLPTPDAPTGDVAWPSAENCLVVTLAYPNLTRSKLFRNLRRELKAEGWRLIRKKHAAKGTLEYQARKSRRQVPLIFSTRKRAALLTIYNCEKSDS
jgi:hypothetical protein